MTHCPRAANLPAVLAGVCLSLAGGAALAQPQDGSRSFAPAPASPGVLPDRDVRARALVDLTYSRPAFDLSLGLSDAGDVLTRGQRFGVVARADRPAVLLLLSIDPTGVLSILYPLTPAELEPASSLQATCEAVAPFGSEVLKLFAFDRIPDGLDRWLGRQVDVLDPDVDQLLRLLREPGTESAEARLRVHTTGDAARGHRRR